jgi:hypothetical protein
MKRQQVMAPGRFLEVERCQEALGQRGIPAGRRGGIEGLADLMEFHLMQPLLVRHSCSSGQGSNGKAGQAKGEGWR